MNTSRKTYALILAGALLWCGSILLAPYLAASSSPLAAYVYQAFHPICHQLPERSFHLFGAKLAVCSRCASIYFAFLFGILLYPCVRTLSNIQTPHRNILVVALLPMLIDVGLDFVGVHASTFFTRTLGGTLFGIVVPFFVLPAAIEGVQQLVTQKQITIVEHQKGIFHA